MSQDFIIPKCESKTAVRATLTLFSQCNNKEKTGQLGKATIEA